MFAFDRERREEIVRWRNFIKLVKNDGGGIVRARREIARVISDDDDDENDRDHDIRLIRLINSSKIKSNFSRRRNIVTIKFCRCVSLKYVISKKKERKNIFEIFEKV